MTHAILDAVQASFDRADQVRDPDAMDQLKLDLHALANAAGFQAIAIAQHGGSNGIYAERNALEAQAIIDKIRNRSEVAS